MEVSRIQAIIPRVDINQDGVSKVFINACMYSTEFPSNVRNYYQIWFHMTDVRCYIIVRYLFGIRVMSKR